MELKRKTYYEVNKKVTGDAVGDAVFSEIGNLFARACDGRTSLRGLKLYLALNKGRSGWGWACRDCVKRNRCKMNSPEHLFLTEAGKNTYLRKISWEKAEVMLI